MIKEIEKSEEHVRQLRKTSDKLMRVMDIQSEPGTEVQAEVAKVKHKQRDLASSLHMRRSALLKCLKLYGQFLGAVEEIEAWLPEAQEKLESQAKAAEDPEEIKQQLEELQVSPRRLRGKPLFYRLDCESAVASQYCAAVVFNFVKHQDLGNKLNT